MKAISGLKLSTCASFQMPRSCKSDLLHRGRLDKDETEAAQRVAAEMHEVKGAAGVSGVAAIVDHRRHHEAIFQRETPDRKWLEQHWQFHVAAVDCPVCHADISCERSRYELPPPRSPSRSEA